MQKKIWLITLLMVFVLSTGMVMAGNMNGNPKGNNNWGPVEQPTNVSASYNDGTDTITICWTPTDSLTETTVPAEKWSVVLYSTAIFFWNPDCLDYYGCTSCPDTIDVKLDYDANEDVYDGGGGKKCIDLSGEMVASDVNDYLNEELEDCMNCQSMDCLYGWTMDPAMTKVKGLAPEKYRRQNNRFSVPVEVNNYEDWYDKWVNQR
jgi:hypothetical protein